MFPRTKPLAGTQINPLHPLSKGLVGCWLFNEGAGSLANDISGYKNHGRLTNMAPNIQGSGWGSSEFGGSLEFDGVNDYVDCGVMLPATSGTIDLWMNMSDVSINGRPISDAGGYCYLEMYAGGALRFTIYDGAGKNTPYHYLTGRDNEWIHVTGVWGDNGFIRLYVDGNLIGSTLAGSIFDVSNSVYIGGAGSDYNGSIDSVRIYNRALSAEEIAWLYKEPYTMFEPAINPALLYSAAPPIGAIMNQFQKANIGADLYNGVFA